MVARRAQSTPDTVGSLLVGALIQVVAVAQVLRRADSTLDTVGSARRTAFASPLVGCASEGSQKAVEQDSGRPARNAVEKRAFRSGTVFLRNALNQRCFAFKRVSSKTTVFCVKADRGARPQALATHIKSTALTLYFALFQVIEASLVDFVHPTPARNYPLGRVAVLGLSASPARLAVVPCPVSQAALVGAAPRGCLPKASCARPAVVLADASGLAFGEVDRRLTAAVGGQIPMHFATVGGQIHGRKAANKPRTEITCGPS